MSIAQPSVIAMSPRRFASIGQVGVRVGEVLGVTRFVEQRRPVVVPADRLDHEHHLSRHLDRCTEGARALPGALLEVEVDVLLGGEVDAEVGQRRLEAGEHALGGIGGVELGGAEETRHVGRARLGEADAEPLAEEAVARLLPERLGLVEQGAALPAELVEGVAEAAVELVVVRRAEARRPHRGRSAPPRGRAG